MLIRKPHSLSRWEATPDLVRYPAIAVDWPASGGHDAACAADDPASVLDDPASVVDDPASVVDGLASVVDDPASVVDDPASPLASDASRCCCPTLLLLNAIHCENITSYSPYWPLFVLQAFKACIHTSSATAPRCAVSSASLYPLLNKAL